MNTDLQIVQRWDGTSHVVQSSAAKKTLCKWQFRPEQIARSAPWDPFQAVNLANQDKPYVDCQRCDYRANLVGGVYADEDGECYVDDGKEDER